jgi:hypothetical protein
MQIESTIDVPSALAIASALLAIGATFAWLPRMQKDLDAHKAASRKELDNLWSELRTGERNNSAFREKVAWHLPSLREDQ